MFQLHAGEDPNVPPFTSRMDLALWILRGSPKLCWLVNYVNEKKKQAKRVALFVMWPVTQWLIEAVFKLLGFNCLNPQRKDNKAPAGGDCDILRPV